MIGATNFWTALTNVSGLQAGNYAVVVSNNLGTVHSQTAKLFVRGGNNDSFQLPQTIPAIGGRILSSNTDATKEPGEPAHAGNPGGASVWFAWRATVTGAVGVDTIGSTFDTLLAVYTGDTVSNLTVIAADDDGANFQFNSKLTFQAAAGILYRIAVDGYDGAMGTIDLSLTPEQTVVTLSLLKNNSTLVFGVRGPVGQKFVIAGSTNFQTWSPIGTSSIPDLGTISLPDLQGTNAARRFFRAELQ